MVEIEENFRKKRKQYEMSQKAVLHLHSAE